MRELLLLFETQETEKKTSFIMSSIGHYDFLKANILDIMVGQALSFETNFLTELFIVRK